MDLLTNAVTYKVTSCTAASTFNRQYINRLLILIFRYCPRASAFQALIPLGG